MSSTLLDAAIDAVLEEHDPDARLRFRDAARGRDIQFGKPEDSTGTSSVWGRVYTTDAELYQRRVAAIIATVCHDDPRTLRERRSDAFGAIAAGVEGLACRCGKPDCPNPTGESRPAPVHIHVVADEQAVQAARAELEAAAAPRHAPPATKSEPLGTNEDDAAEPLAPRRRTIRWTLATLLPSRPCRRRHSSRQRHSAPR